MGRDAEFGRGLLAVQEVGVVLVREIRDGLAQEIGVDLLAVVQARTGAGRADRRRDPGAAYGFSFR
ncbi:hypothetical protein [Streptomyces sp. NPDC053728]|uniref:hypothetical protein n=1 Tax=Streptomyces sp. NPDC053728 TaxID=3155534 RepID=UPI0034302CC8